MNSEVMLWIDYHHVFRISFIWLGELSSRANKDIFRNFNLNVYLDVYRVMMEQLGTNCGMLLFLLCVSLILK
jgi:hypothetical protein